MCPAAADAYTDHILYVDRGGKPRANPGTMNKTSIRSPGTGIHDLFLCDDTHNAGRLTLGNLVFDATSILTESNSSRDMEAKSISPANP